MKPKPRAQLIQSILRQDRNAKSAKNQLTWPTVRQSSSDYLYFLNAEHIAKKRKGTLIRHAKHAAKKDPKLGSLLKKIGIR